MNRKILLSVLIGIAMLQYIGLTNVFANETNYNEPILLDSVVVTGTRTEHLVEDVPSTMELVTSEDIKRMNAKTPLDVLEQTFNIETTGVHGGGVSLRGMNSDHTLVLVNGRRPAGAGGIGEVNGQILRTINAANIERIEILRGPAGALYGANALAGVINIITKRSEEKEITVGTSVGNYGVNTYGSIDFGKMGKDDAWDALVSAQFDRLFAVNQDSEFEKSGGWTESPDGFNGSFSFDIGYKFNLNHELRLQSDISHDDYTKENFVIDYAMGGPNPYESTYTEDYTERTRYSSTLIYSGNVGDHLYSISGQFSEMRDKNPEDNTGRHNYTDVFTEYGFDAQDTWLINDYNTLTVGGEIIHSKIDAKNVSDTDSQTRYAVYAQNEMSLFDDKFLIIPAVRYDYYDTFGNSLTPSIGLVWEFIENHRFKANYGLGFRAPGLLDLYGTQSRGFGDLRPNPDLDPEKSKSFEFRYEGSYKNLSGSIGYFHTDIEDYLDQVFYDSNGNVTTGRPDYAMLQNVDDVTIQGVELDLQLEFLTHFTAKFQYAYTDSMNETKDVRLRDSAKNTYTGELLFDYEPWDFYASVWARYYDQFYTFQDKNIDFYRVNLSMGKTWKDKYTVSLNVNNLFYSNQDYENETYLLPTEVSVGFEMKF